MISGNSEFGVRIQDANTDFNTVAGNYIGTNVAGTGTLGNGNVGVWVAYGARNNLIGTSGSNALTDADARNVISGNGWDGVQLYGVGTVDNVVAGNYIGVDATGNVAMHDGASAISIFGGASDNRVGTSGAEADNAGERNVIDADNYGVFICDSNTTGNLVAGNYIGIDAAGTTAPGVGNNTGVYDQGANNTIGGTTAVMANVIAGNTTYDIQLGGGNLADGESGTFGATGNLIEGNLIGTNPAGTAAIPNGDNGIYIEAGTDNTIRGSVTGNVYNAGILSPGTAGTLAITGNYTQTSSGTLDIGIGSASSYGQVSVSGTATLAGTLTAAVVNSYSPPLQLSFQPLTYGSLSGSFATLNVDLGNGTSVLPTYNATNLTLTTTADASTVYWTNSNGGDWDTASNWSTGTVPTASNTVFIGLSGYSFTVTHSANVADSVSSLLSLDPIVLSGGSFALAASSTVDDLLVDGGTLLASGNLTVTGAFTWSGGELTGGGTVTVATAGTLTIDGGILYLVGETLTNLGTATWTLGYIEFDNGAVFNNAGTLTLQLPGNYYTYLNQGDAGTFNNSGTLIQASSSGITNGLGDGVVFNNSGSVQVQSGNLGVGGGTSSGSFSVAAGSDLELSGQTLSSASSVTGAGQVDWSSSTVAGLYNISGTTNVDSGLVDFTGTVSNVGQAMAIGGTADFNAGSVSAASFSALRTLAISGTADFNGNALNLNTLTISGTLQDSAGVAVAGAMTWGSGTLTGGGTVTVAAAGTLTIDGGISYLVGDTLTNLGTATWTLGYIEFDDGAVFNNAGTLTLQLPGNYYTYLNQGTAGTFNNSGTLIQASSSGITNGLGDGVAFNNSGSVQVQSGNLGVGGGTSSGSFSVAAGSDLELSGQTLSSASSVTGAGQVDWSSSTVAGLYNISGTTNVDSGLVDFTGTVSNVGQAMAIGGTADFNAGSVSAATFSALRTLAISGTADFNGNALNLNTLTISGTLQDSAGVAVAGAMTWGSGTLTGGGTVTVAAAGTLTIDGGISYLVGDTLTNLGTATWTLGYIEFDDGAVFNNAGTLTLQLPGNYYTYLNQGAAGTFNNSGTLIQASSSGITNGLGDGVAFNNSGSVQVQSGNLGVGGGTSSGSFSVAAGSDLELSGQTLSSASSVTGAGQVDWSSSTVAGLYNISGTTNVDSGLVDFTGTVSNVGQTMAIGGTADFNAGSVSAATFSALQTLAISGTADFNGNALSVTTLNVSGTLEDSAGVAVSGALDWSGDGELTGGGTVTVAAAGTLTIANGGGIFYLVGETLTNLGTATWTEGYIEFDDGAVFNNSGTLTLQLPGNYYTYLNQGTAGTFNNSGTLIQASSSGITNGLGDGVAFNNSGSVQVQSGALSFGAYNQTAGSTELTGGSISAGGGFNIQGGSLGGVGTIVGNVTSAGPGEPRRRPRRSDHPGQLHASEQRRPQYRNRQCDQLRSAQRHRDGHACRDAECHAGERLRAVLAQ